MDVSLTTGMPSEDMPDDPRGRRSRPWPSLASIQLVVVVTGGLHPVEGAAALRRGPVHRATALTSSAFTQ